MSWPGVGPIWIMGCGNMGGALLERWLETGLAPERVHVIDPAPPRIDGIGWTAEPPQGSPDLLLLGVKPQMLDMAAGSLISSIGTQTIILSILAGVETQSLRAAFPKAGSIVRAMPNLPVRLGKGVTGLFSSDADQTTRAAVDSLFAETGQAEWIGDENLFHAITALSGSGPAFVYRFIAALAEGGTALGLPADQALRLAQAMVEGAAALSISSGKDPETLAREVASPNGTTAAGLAVQDTDGSFARIVASTLAAAASRSEELAQAAR